MERTFAIIKPDAVAARKTGAILAKIQETGFNIRGMKMLRLSNIAFERSAGLARVFAIVNSTSLMSNVGP